MTLRSWLISEPHFSSINEMHSQRSCSTCFPPSGLLAPLCLLPHVVHSSLPQTLFPPLETHSEKQWVMYVYISWPLSLNIPGLSPDSWGRWDSKFLGWYRSTAHPPCKPVWPGKDRAISIDLCYEHRENSCYFPNLKSIGLSLADEGRGFGGRK